MAPACSPASPRPTSRSRRARSPMSPRPTSAAASSATSTSAPASPTSSARSPAAGSPTRRSSRWFDYTTPFWATLVLLAARPASPPCRLPRPRAGDPTACASARAFASLAAVLHAWPPAAALLGELRALSIDLRLLPRLPDLPGHRFHMAVSRESLFVAWVAVRSSPPTLGIVAWLARRLTPLRTPDASDRARPRS